MKFKSNLSSYRNQHELYKTSFKNQFSQFASLENLKLQISDDEVEFFSSHLEELKSDIDRRFNDVFQINVDLQESFSELKTDLELKVNFSNARCENFCTQQKLR